MDRQKQIANSLETYFSDANLQWDKAMQQHISKRNDGCIPVVTLANLKKMKQLQATDTEIKEAAITHSMTRLKISKDGSSIGRIKPFVLSKKEELDDWSIYVEGLGKKYNTERDISDLFKKHVGRVSYLRFPEDRNGNPRFQGYCFIEFDYKDHVQKAVDVMNQESATDENIIKLGLRVIPKRRWIEYRDEYNAHQNKVYNQVKRLWSDYSREQQEEETVASKNNKPKEQKHQKPAPATDNEYPKNIIVFVQNTHPKSPKTAIKTLLEQSGASITFLKHKKGVDSCHVRLETPEDTIKLVDYFKTHTLVQSSGTDTKGTVDVNSPQAIKVRAITGNEEKIYWMADQKGGK